jgi:hypothetical protein
MMRCASAVRSVRWLADQLINGFSSPPTVKCFVEWRPISLQARVTRDCCTSSGTLGKDTWATTYRKLPSPLLETFAGVCFTPLSRYAWLQPPSECGCVLLISQVQ